MIPNHLQALQPPFINTNNINLVNYYKPSLKTHYIGSKQFHTFMHKYCKCNVSQFRASSHAYFPSHFSAHTTYRPAQITSLPRETRPWIRVPGLTGKLYGTDIWCRQSKAINDKWEIICTIGFALSEFLAAASTFII